MKAWCAFSVMLAPSTATPHWSGLPSPFVSFVSFFAAARNSDHVFGGSRPSSSKSLVL